MPYCFFIAMAFLAVPALAHNNGFLSRYDIVGKSTDAVSSGDFNNDGVSDLAVLANSGENVRVLFGNGDGTFRNGPSISLGGQAGALAPGDVNGDGKLDLVALGGLEAWVLLGNGDGTFAIAFKQSLAAAPSYAVVGLADFNGDGKLDFAASDYNGFTVSLGNGDGTFQPPSSYSFPYITGFTIGDVNLDGKADLAVVGGFNAVEVLLGRGDGTFRAPIPAPVPVVSQMVAIGDVNGDGKPDMVSIATASVGATYTNTPISILFGNSDGTFQPPVNYDLPNFLKPLFSVALADVNEDLSKDLVLGSQVGYVLTMANSGTGTFQLTLELPVSLGYAVDNMVVGDFNCDGQPDIAVSNSGGGEFFSVLIHVGRTSYLEPAHTSTQGGSGFAPVAAADFNGDGHPDLVTAVDTYQGLAPNQLRIFAGTGKAVRPFVLTGSASLSSGPSAMLAGDFNHDGFTDVVAVSPSGLTFLPGNGDGTFGTPLENATGSQALQLAAADLNRDGRLDVVSSSGYLYLGNGDGTFQPAVRIATPPSEFSSGGSVAVADLNGDGKPDVILSPAGPTYNQYGFQVLLGNGDGTFQPPIVYTAGGSPEAAAVADFNGDGILDVAVLNGSAGGIQPQNVIAILLGKGDGTFDPPQYVKEPLFSFPSQILAADLNGDGNVDLAVLDSGNSEVFVWDGNGDGTFGAASWYGTGSFPLQLVAGNFAGQTKPGLPDLVTVQNLIFYYGPAQSVTFVDLLKNRQN